LSSEHPEGTVAAIAKGIHDVMKKMRPRGRNKKSTF
jgi:hypothetical protein